VTVLTNDVIYARRSGTLYDVLELILDRGMVIDAFIRISLVGIEIIKIDARIVVASVDTYLRFADVCNRLDLEHDRTTRTVPDLFSGMSGSAASAAGKKSGKKALGSAGKKAEGLKDKLRRDDAQDGGGSRSRHSKKEA
jgi:hypothetical protein